MNLVDNYTADLRDYICILDITIQICIKKRKEQSVIDLMKRDLAHYQKIYKRMGGR